MIVFGLLSTFLPAVILIFIIAYAAKNKEQGGEKVIRHLYTYLVLFATLMMVIGGGISVFMATADLVSPPGYFQTYTEYKQMRTSEKMDGNVELSEKEIRSAYEQAVEDEENRTQQRAKNQIIKSLGFILIPLPVFVYFNGMRKKIKEE